MFWVILMLFLLYLIILPFYLMFVRYLILKYKIKKMDEEVNNLFETRDKLRDIYEISNKSIWEKLPFTKTEKINIKTDILISNNWDLEYFPDYYVDEYGNIYIAKIHVYRLPINKLENYKAKILDKFKNKIIYDRLFYRFDVGIEKWLFFIIEYKKVGNAIDYGLS